MYLVEGDFGFVVYEVFQVAVHKVEAEVYDRGTVFGALFVDYFVNVEDVGVLESLQQLYLPQSRDGKT